MAEELYLFTVVFCIRGLKVIFKVYEMYLGFFAMKEQEKCIR